MLRFRRKGLDRSENEEGNTEENHGLLTSWRKTAFVQQASKIQPDGGGRYRVVVGWECVNRSVENVDRRRDEARGE